MFLAVSNRGGRVKGFRYRLEKLVQHFRSYDDVGEAVISIEMKFKKVKIKIKISIIWCNVKSR